MGALVQPVPGLGGPEQLRGRQRVWRQRGGRSQQAPDQEQLLEEHDGPAGPQPAGGEGEEEAQTAGAAGRQAETQIIM